MALPDPEGLIRFRLEHASRPLAAPAHAALARELAAWRRVLRRLGVLGRDPARYGGLAFGNASARLAPFAGVPAGLRRFLVTGSQTGGRADVSLREFALLECWDLAAHRATSSGEVTPSSESLTHAALYDASEEIRAVLHAHAPELWRHARALGVPVTDPAAANGTPAMSAAVARLGRDGALAHTGVAAMGGHEDGVLAWGTSPADAGVALVRALARALALDA